MLKRTHPALKSIQSFQEICLNIHSTLIFLCRKKKNKYTLIFAHKNDFKKNHKWLHMNELHHEDRDKLEYRKVNLQTAVG